jgi:outer membrane receptor protein involved in Fe transport
VEYRVGTTWKFAAAYVYDQATVTKNPANTTLVGKVLPQVPTHRGSVRAAYANPRVLSLAVSAQFTGSQFDDDLNTRTRVLPEYAVVDLTAWRELGRGAEMFLGVQNLFDAEYFVGTVPTTIGAPRLVTGGIRLRLR